MTDPFPSGVSLLVERAHEQHRLRQLIDHADRGTGGIALIEGTGGIGKSALLTDAAVAAEAADHLVLRATGTELEREFTFGGVQQLLGSVVHGASAEQRQRWFAGAAGAAHDLFGERDRVPETPTPDTRFRLLHGLYWLLVNLSDDRPVVVALDDFQWLDDATRELAVFCAHRIGATPVVLVIASRTDPGGDAVPIELRRASTTTHVTLAPLSADGIGQLAARLLGGTPNPRLVAACREATGGLPFYAVALLHRLAAVPPQEQLDAVSGLAPEVVVRTVTGQLEREHDSVLAVARATAVLGPAASLPRIADVAGIDRDVALQALGRLAELRLADVSPRDPGRHALVHPIVDAAVLSALTAAEAGALHERAAVRLRADPVPPEQVAAHLLRTPAGGQPWVVAVLRRSADAALTRGGAADAAAYLRRALLEDVGDLVDVAYELGRAEVAQAPLAAIEHLTRAVEDGRDAPWWTDAVRLLARALAFDNRPADAVRLIERVTADLEAERSTMLLVDWYFFSMIAGQSARAEERADEIEALLERHDPVAARLLLGSATLYRVQHNRPAAAMAAQARRAWGTGDLLDVEPAGSQLLWSPLASMVATDDHHHAERGVNELLAASRPAGSRSGLGIALYLRALLRLKCGTLAEAQADAEEALEHTTEALPFLAPLSAALVIEVLLERGRRADARQLAARWAGRSRRFGPGPGDGLEIACALVDLADERWHEADLRLTTAAERLRQWGNPGVAVVTWRPAAALAAAGCGDTDRAVAVATEYLRLAREFGAPYPIGVALRVTAQVSPPSDRLQLLEESAAVFAGSPHQLELARTRLHLGAALGREGHPADARRLLELAMDGAEQCGARPLAEQAADELRAVGARPRRLALSGVDALTPSELRVAQLAAARSATNRAIAEELFVTVKTVEVHLTNTYRKLGIRSRDDLAGALARGDQPTTAGRAQ